jgi:hypothetical protein
MSDDRPSPTDAPPVEPRRYDAAGAERPAFVLAFPADPQLDALVAAYERGDFATVRRDARRLAETAETEAVRTAALELRRRITPDPMVVWFLATSILLLIFLVAWSYWVGHR